jgi:hypothetical protein
VEGNDDSSHVDTEKEMEAAEEEVEIWRRFA